MRHAWPLLLATLTLVAGCSDGAPAIKSKYADAALRLAQSVDGGYSDLRTFTVPGEASHLAIRASFVADQGIAFALRRPDGTQELNLQYAARVRQEDMQWIQALEPRSGVWRVSLSCERRCEYSFGIDFFDAVEPLGLDRSQLYRDADKRFTGGSEGFLNQANDFVVPEGIEWLSVRWSEDADGAFSFRLRDPGGLPRSSVRFPHESSVGESSNDLVHRPASGNWRFEVGCEAGCTYAFGFYLEPSQPAGVRGDGSAGIRI